jgi:hypothetical protein
MKSLVLVALLAACSSKTHPPGTPGSGSGSNVVVTNASCDEVRPKVEELYRAEARAKEPKRVEEAVSDNTQMVMGDCVKTNGKIAPCVKAASTVEAIEACLVPIDDEGTEGEAFKK